MTKPKLAARARDPQQHAAHLDQLADQIDANIADEKALRDTFRAAAAALRSSNETNQAAVSTPAVRS